MTNIVEDLVMFALQTGPATSSKVARLFGISNQEAKRMLRIQVDAGYVVEEYEAGERIFRLAEPEELLGYELND